MRLENTTGTSSKFWQVEVQGKECHVQYGKIGSDGRSNVKSFDSVAEAKAYAKTKTDEKLGGGYIVADGFDGVSSAPVVVPKAPATAGGVLAARLNIALDKNEEVSFDASKFQKSARHLKGVKKELKESIKSLEEYVPDVSSALASISAPLDPQQLVDLQSLALELKTLTRTALKALKGNPPSGKITESNVTKLYDFSKTLDTVIENQELPFSMRLRSNGPHARLRVFAGNLRRSLPSLEKLKEPPPVLLSAAEFVSLSTREKAKLALNAESRGYSKESLHDDDEAEAFVKTFVGSKAIKEMLEYVIGIAEDDSDASEEPVEMGDPSFSEVIAIKNGNEIIAYQIETHVNWQPQDNDLIGVHYVDLKGEVFQNDQR